MTTVNRWLAGLGLALAVATGTSAQTPCGADAPCATANGEYFAALPAAGDGPYPVLLYFHGWGSSGKNVINNRGITGLATMRGYAVIAPQGLRPLGHRQRTWAHQGSPSSARDETAFVREVIADAINRLNLDPTRILVSGFSQGGSMAWHLACLDAGRYTAFAPMAGAFWRPHPERCDSPARRLLHVHGWTDGIVPLEGRPIGPWHQGDVFEALREMRNANQCADGPSEFGERAGLPCRGWNRCAGGATIEFCQHQGGHTIPKGWMKTILDWFEHG